MPATDQTRQTLGQLMEFVLNRNGKFLRSWVFLLPPESFEAEEPVRQNTMRTVAGGYSDLFGPDLPPITIEGTTGASVRKLEGGNMVDGFSYWIEFLQLIYRTFVESPLANPTDEYTLHFYNWTLRQYWDVMPTVCTWDMATPESGVFYYQMELTALQPLTQPHSQPPGQSYDSLINNGTLNFVSVAKNGATHGAMSQQLLGLSSGLSSYGQQLLSAYDYSESLPPRYFPTAQYYPGITSLLPSVTSYLQQIQPIQESAAQASSFPSTLSYGQVQLLATQGNALWQQLDALSPAPICLNAEFGDAVSSLANLLLYPELMST